ncbi:MerR family transcriptional regulator [Celeribacter sp. SCSIO 80788]|uniref:MerR family transcriptional regulator n=1 Tax=Celeribacter sp. SCSIO 80788 TaxID=3117013 RepID=UPI003DA1ED2B
MDKSPDAFRTISEVADWLDTPAHVLRFWESRFTQVKPVKRAGGRRYYRPADMALLGGIKKLLHDDGMTIRGVQKLLREHGVKYVASLSPEIEGIEPISAPAPEHSPIPPAPFAPMAEMVPQDDFDSPEPEERVIPFARPEPTSVPTLPITAVHETKVEAEEVTAHENTDLEDLTANVLAEEAIDTAGAETVFGQQTAEIPSPPKAPLPGQASFDFDLSPTVDLFEEPDLIEAEDEIEETYVAPEPSVFAAPMPLGGDLEIPGDPLDEADLGPVTPGILGQLNHRQLRHLPQAELAALMTRAAALRARMAG